MNPFCEKCQFSHQMKKDDFIIYLCAYQGDTFMDMVGVLCECGLGVFRPITDLIGDMCGSYDESPTFAESQIQTFGKKKVAKKGAKSGDKTK